MPVRDSSQISNCSHYYTYIALQASTQKMWAAVGRLFKAPRHMTTMSHTFKAAYAKLLLPFEEVNTTLFATVCTQQQ